MSILLETIVMGLLIGVVFGFALEKARVFEPGIIIGQFQFRNFIMLKVFLMAVATGLLIFTAFQWFGYERLSWKVTVYKADILGGLSLGVGIALAGSCPGTLFAQLGAGYKDALMTLLGALLGAFTFMKLQGSLQRILLSGYPNENLTLDGVLGLSFWVIAVVLMVMIFIALYFLESKQTWTDELGHNYDGLK